MSSINNSSLTLPDTRLDLHTRFTEGDFVSSYLAVCDQLQHSVLAIFSGLQETSVNHHGPCISYQFQPQSNIDGAFCP